MIYFCSQPKRRALVLQHPTLNGIDFLEVCDSGADCGCGKKLLLTLLKDARAPILTTAQIRISGGAATAQVHAVNVNPSTAAARLVTIDLDSSGDFSTYTLALVANPNTSDPPDG